MKKTWIVIIAIIIISCLLLLCLWAIIFINLPHNARDEDKEFNVKITLNYGHFSGWTKETIYYYNISVELDHEEIFIGSHLLSQETPDIEVIDTFILARGTHDLRVTNLDTTELCGGDFGVESDLFIVITCIEDSLYINYEKEERDWE